MSDNPEAANSGGTESDETQAEPSVKEAELNSLQTSLQHQGDEVGMLMRSLTSARASA